VIRLESPADADAVLARTAILASAPADQVRALSDVVDWWYLEAGTPLFDTGDEADGMYLVLRGRLESRVDGMVLGEVAPGGTIGETAVLARRARTSSAYAVRDSVVARLPPERLADLAETSPQLSLEVARLAAGRAPLEPHPVRGRTAARSVAVVRLDGSTGATDWARQLAARLDRLGSARVVTEAEIAAWAGDGSTSFAAQSAAAEDAHDIVLLPVEPAMAATPTAGLVLRHVDAVVGVAAAARAPDRRALHLVEGGRAPVALALLHRPGRAPIGTARWLDAVGATTEIRSHTHLTDGDVVHLDRLARGLRGRAIGLVLGGGGSRGFAHIGVLRALAEIGVTIDHVGGSSMGAIMGAQVAAGWSADEMLERNVAAWSRGQLLELGLPTLSLLRGRRARRVLHRLFAGLQIEDLWLEFFCTTVDLSAYALDVRRRGAVADWVGASSTVPGLWPPLVDDQGHLHVDGGLLDNVPTAVMRAGHAGPVIGVDVCHRQAALTVEPRSVLPAGVALVRARLEGRWSPSILDVVNRGNLLASLRQHAHAERFADLYIAPPVEDMGFAAFDRIHRLAEMGYRTTIEAFDRADAADLDLIGRAS
jgi:NTE family protein